MARKRFDLSSVGTGNATDTDIDTVSGVVGGGSEGTGTPTLNPAELGLAAGDGGTGSTLEGTGKKPRKPRAPKAAKSAPLDISSVKNGLVITHMLAASVFGASELALTEDQAAVYAVAAQDVLSHYDVGATAKTIAWVNLVGIMVGVYGTKMSEIAKRKAAEKAARVKAANNSQLVPRADMSGFSTGNIQGQM